MDQGFGQEIAGHKVRNQEEVGIPGYRTVIAFDPGRFPAESQIKGDGALDLAAPDQALLIHLFQGGRPDGFRHPLMHLFDGGQAGNLGFLNPQGMQDIHGVFKNTGQLLPAGIHDHAPVRQDRKLVIGRDVQEGHMRDQAAGQEAVVLVDHLFQKNSRVDIALEDHVIAALAGPCHRLPGGLHGGGKMKVPGPLSRRQKNGLDQAHFLGCQGGFFRVFIGTDQGTAPLDGRLLHLFDNPAKTILHNAS